MRFIFCILKKDKAKVCMIGKTLDIFTMTVTICHTVAERISKEKKIELNKALSMILEGIEESKDTLKR